MKIYGLTNKNEKFNEDTDIELDGLSNLYDCPKFDYAYCPICLENYYVNKINLLPCNHYLCEDCLFTSQVRKHREMMLRFCAEGKNCNCDRAVKKYISRLDTTFFKCKNTYHVNECPVCKVCCFDENEKFIPLLLKFKYNFCQIVKKAGDVKYMRRSNIYKQLLEGLVVGLKSKRTVIMTIWFTFDFEFDCSYMNYNPQSKQFCEEHIVEFDTYEEDFEYPYMIGVDKILFYVALNYTKSINLTKLIIDSPVNINSFLE